MGLWYRRDNTRTRGDSVCCRLPLKAKEKRTTSTRKLEAMEGEIKARKVLENPKPDESNQSGGRNVGK